MIVQQYHVHVASDIWHDFIKNEDLRFFMYMKNKKLLLKSLIDTHDSGVIVKLSSWDNMFLKSSYILSNTFKHINFIQHLCYFEYEEDIFEYLYPIGSKNSQIPKRMLSNNTLEFAENAVVIFPYYKNLSDLSEFDLNRNDLITCIQQIILSIYYAYFKHNILFTNIDINNIYLDRQNKSTKIKYEFEKKIHTIQSQYIVKIDEFIHVKDITGKTQDISNLYDIYSTIIQVLKQIKKYDVAEIIDFIEDFHILDIRMIHPLKTIDMILSQAHCAKLS